MALSLNYIGETKVPVEVEGLTPDWACDKTLAEIERFEIFHGNRKIPLAEMFRVSGDPSDKVFLFAGNLSGVHWIGAHMASGEIVIDGPAGRHLGSEMSGGQIHAHGNVDGWAGAEMHGGLIHIRGNAGHLVGAAYRGSAKGMTRGTILVNGSAGNEVGHTMRRGLIAVGGSAGDLAGFNMLAGTILIFGESGIRPGAGMRRGTIGLLGSQQVRLLPTFRRAASMQPQFVRLLLRDIQNRGMQVDAELLNAELDVYHGDLVALGRGEVLMRRAA